MATIGVDFKIKTIQVDRWEKNILDWWPKNKIADLGHSRVGEIQEYYLDVL